MSDAFDGDENGADDGIDGESEEDEAEKAVENGGIESPEPETDVATVEEEEENLLGGLEIVT
ncbi:MAG: hypothetical protein SV760_05050, partial [Halobacteria archaeon]|nr:hypothetical protein [Halobacteria archaeon]